MPATDWRDAFRSTLADELIGPPRPWRWVRNLLWLALTVAIALATPRIDHWPQAYLWPIMLPLFPIVSALRPWHRERLLGRSRTRQTAVYVATVVARAIMLVVFVSLSVTLGAELGESLIERLFAQLPATDFSLWLFAGLLLVFALVRYRADKREEAALRAQGAAERKTG